MSTVSPLAQRYFDQGLRLAFAFNHAEARRAFRTAQKHDPDCAMCFWGEALVLGPNINAPMDAEAVAPALAAVREAAQRRALPSAREQALIAALASATRTIPRPTAPHSMPPMPQPWARSPSGFPMTKTSRSSMRRR